MGWTVLEKMKYAKDPHKGTEDSEIFVGNRCYAVLDGHTNFPGQLINGMTHGQYVVQAGLRAFERYENGDPLELVRSLTAHVGNEWRKTGQPWERRPGFVFVAFIPERNLIVRVGDCQYFIDGDNDPKRNAGLMVDRVKSEVRANMLIQLLKTHTVNDLIENDLTRQIMAEMKKWQHTYRNNRDSTFGYGVIDGTTVPTLHIEYDYLKVVPKLVVLTSDGYPPRVVRETLEETEFELAELLKRDPLCYREWIAVRGIGNGLTRPDDCTYLSLSPNR